MSGVAQDLFALPGAWRPFAEHVEDLALDFQPESGPAVVLRGKAVAWPSSERIFVEAGSGCDAAGLNLWEVSGALTAAVLDGRIGSGTLRKAIELDWDVGSASANGGAA